MCVCVGVAVLLGFFPSIGLLLSVEKWLLVDLEKVFFGSLLVHHRKFPFRW